MPDTRPKVGRPPLDRADRSTTLSIVLRSRQYDTLHRRAQRDGISIGEVIRRQLQDIDDDDDTDD